MFSVFWLVLWQPNDAQVPEKTSESACGCGFPTELFGAVHNLGFGKNRKISYFSKCPHRFGMGASENYRKNMLFQMHYSHTWGRIAAWRKWKFRFPDLKVFFFLLELKVFFSPANHIKTSTHQHISTSRHQHINTSTHHISTPTHQHINTSTHQRINTSRSQHINTSKTSTHQHTVSSTQSLRPEHMTHQQRINMSAQSSTQQHINEPTHPHISTTHQRINHVNTSTHQHINTILNSSTQHINESAQCHQHINTPNSIFLNMLRKFTKLFKSIFGLSASYFRRVEFGPSKFEIRTHTPKLSPRSENKALSSCPHCQNTLFLWYATMNTKITLWKFHLYRWYSSLIFWKFE